MNRSGVIGGSASMPLPSDEMRPGTPDDEIRADPRGGGTGLAGRNAQQKHGGGVNLLRGLGPAESGEQLLRGTAVSPDAAVKFDANTLYFRSQIDPLEKSSQILGLGAWETTVKNPKSFLHHEVRSMSAAEIRHCQTLLLANRELRTKLDEYIAARQLKPLELDEELHSTGAAKVTKTLSKGLAKVGLGTDLNDLSDLTPEVLGRGLSLGSEYIYQQFRHTASRGQSIERSACEEAITHFGEDAVNAALSKLKMEGLIDEVLPQQKSAPAGSAKFDEVLLNVDPFTLFAFLRGVSIPAKLTDEQKSQVRTLLKDYDPKLLTAPVVNVDGKPISLDVDYNSARDFRFGLSVELSKNQHQAISTIFTDYSTHLKWQDEHIAVREVSATDVPEREAELVGEDGVFLKKALPKDAFVLLFDGMLLEKAEDIENDKKLRQLAGCDSYYTKSVSREGRVLEGMGASMKLNTATMLHGNNLDAIGINAVNRDTGEELKLILFKTNREISENEQLCFKYLIDNKR